MTTSTLDLRRQTLIDWSEVPTRLPSIEQPAGAPHSFWPHQKKAFDAALASMTTYGNEIVHVVSLPTGGGKTRVAAAVADHFLRFGHGSQVIWLAPRWQILEQAVSTIEMHFPSLRGHLARAGGSFAALQLPENVNAELVFSTLPTWSARSKSGTPWLVGGRDQLVILDESHWAQNAQQGRGLRKACHGVATVLGLSATPQQACEGDRIAYRCSFGDLCPRNKDLPRFLAAPKVLSAQTGIVWNPLIHNGTIAEISLRELAGQCARNDLIVETVKRSLDERRFTRGIVFAIDRQHANVLTKLMGERGLRVAEVHSGITADRRKDALAAIDDGRIQLVVTCTMLAAGIDLPAVDGVILARPSGSISLLAQMIGRGSRITGSKNQFWILEFNDKLRDQSKRIFHASDYLGEVETEIVRTGAMRPSRPREHSEPKSEPIFEKIHFNGLPELPYVPGQTFGVEIEIGVDGFTGHRDGNAIRCANDLLGCIQNSVDSPVDESICQYHQYSDHTKWRVTWDSSCGLEVVSPILIDAPGFEELAAVCKGVSKLVKDHDKLRIDHHCGLHVTLATRLNTEKLRRAFLGRFSRLEAGLYSLVSPSRLYRFDGQIYSRRARSRYCAPLRDSPETNWNQAIGSRNLFGRYRSLNCTKADGDMQLLEVRMHQGTTDYRKILPWIALWMTIFNHDRYRWRDAANLERVFSGGNQRVSPARADREDIFHLLFEEGIHLEKEFAELIQQRRTDLRPFWEVMHPKRVAGWERANWYRNYF